MNKFEMPFLKLVSLALLFLLVSSTAWAANDVTRLYLPDPDGRGELFNGGLYIYDREANAGLLDDHLRTLADKGLTHHYFTTPNSADEAVYTGYADNVLELSKRYGTKASFQLNFAYWNPSWSEAALDRNAQEAANFINNYRDDSAVMSFSVKEEPHTAQVPRVLAYYNDIVNTHGATDAPLGMIFGAVSGSYSDTAKQVFEDNPYGIYPLVTGFDPYRFIWMSSVLNGVISTPLSALNMLNRDFTRDRAYIRDDQFPMAVIQAFAWSEEKYHLKTLSELQAEFSNDEYQRLLRLADNNNQGLSYFDENRDSILFWNHYNSPINTMSAQTWLAIATGYKGVQVYHGSPGPFSNKPNRHGIMGPDGTGSPQLDEFAETINELHKFAWVINRMKYEGVDTDYVNEFVYVDRAYSGSFSLPGYDGKMVVLMNADVGTWANNSTYWLDEELYRIDENGDVFAEDYTPKTTERSIELTNVIGSSMYDLETGNLIGTSTGSVSIYPGKGKLIFIGSEAELNSLREESGLTDTPTPETDLITDVFVTSSVEAGGLVDFLYTLNADITGNYYATTELFSGSVSSHVGLEEVGDASPMYQLWNESLTTGKSRAISAQINTANPGRFDALSPGTYSLFALIMKPGDEVTEKLGEFVVIGGVPNAFSFTDVVGAELNTLYTTNAISVGGVNTATPIAISGGEYRINSGNWTTVASTVNAGDTVTVRRHSPTNYSAMVSATLTIGGVSDSFDITTKAADTTPNAFSFVDVTNAELNTPYTSNAISVSGINSATPIAISDGEYRINGGSWSSASGNVVADDSVEIRLTSVNTFSTATSATLTIGGISDAFDITTKVDVISEDPITDISLTSSIDVGGVVNFSYTLNVGVTGSHYATTELFAGSVSNHVGQVEVGDASPKYQMWKEALAEGDHRVISGQINTASPGSHAALTPGVYSLFVVIMQPGDDLIEKIGEFVVVDGAPNAFSFADVVSAERNTLYTSNAISVGGVNAATPIAISGGEYRINSGNWTTVSGTVNAGDTVTVRRHSSANFSTVVSATLTIGGVSDSYDITTEAVDITPNAFSFVDLINVKINTSYTSNVITVSGINNVTTIAVSAGMYRINGESWRISKSSIREGDTVELRLMSANTYNTTRSATLTVGNTSATFSITSEVDVTPVEPITDISLTSSVEEGGVVNFSYTLNVGITGNHYATTELFTGSVSNHVGQVEVGDASPKYQMWKETLAEGDHRVISGQINTASPGSHAALTPGVYSLFVVIMQPGDDLIEKIGEFLVIDSETVLASEVLSPVPGSTLSSNTVTFQWQDTGSAQYYLYVGTSPGGLDLYHASQGTNTSVTVSGLPTNGSTIYVKLWTMESNNFSWVYNNYTYTAANN